MHLKLQYIAEEVNFIENAERVKDAAEERVVAENRKRVGLDFCNEIEDIPEPLM